MKIGFASAGALCLLFASLLNAQTIYKWKDEKGQWHFSQTPPSAAKTERVDLPTGRERDLRSRAEWQGFYAAFRDAKYKMDRPNPHTQGLKGFVKLSGICQLQENLSALFFTAGDREEGLKLRDSSRVCAREAEVVFPLLFERTQKEIAAKKPAALEKLRAFGSAWLAAIRRIPRTERPAALQKLQDDDRKIVEQREAELDAELL